MLENKITKEPLSQIIEEMSKEDWFLWFYDKETNYWVWQRKKLKTPKKNPVFEETILYPENKELWKKYSDKLKNAYTTFREDRYTQHKDYVSASAEKLLLNKINKYSESIAIELMKASSSYKSIVEHQDIIEKGLQAVEKERNMQEEERKHKEQQQVVQERKKAEQAIINSCKSRDHWETLAKQELKKQYPSYTDAMIEYQVQPRMRIILKEEGFL